MWDYDHWGSTVMQTAATAEKNSNQHTYTRDDLLVMATERFCDKHSHDRLTVDQYKQAFYQLIGDVGSKTKREVSRLLATCDFTPRAIAIYCALEPLNMARPMLQNSNVLTQRDLNQIIDMRGVSHGLIIAGRRDLADRAIGKLRGLDDPNVNAALLYNPTMTAIRSQLEEDRNKKQVSETGFNAPIDTSFMQRSDEDVLTAGSGPSLNFNSYLEEEAKASAKVEQQDAANPLEQRLLDAAARGGRLPAQETAPAAAEPILSQADFGIALEKAAQAKSRQGMAVLMQKQTGITLDTAYRLLDDRSGDTLSVLLKAVGVNPPQANRILLMTQPSIGLSVQNAMRSVRFYNDLQQVTCQAAVAQWPKDPSLKPIHAPVVEEGRPVRKQRAKQAPKSAIQQDRFNRYTA